MTGVQSGSYIDRWNDCGPASLVACRYNATGEMWSPDQMRDLAYWDGFSGYTDTAHLTKAARDVWGWGATDQSISGLAAYDLIRRHVDQDAYVVTLTKEPPDRYGPNGYNHFCTITGWSTRSVVRHNCLGGRREVLAWSDFTKRFLGWVMLLTPTEA